MQLMRCKKCGESNQDRFYDHNKVKCKACISKASAERVQARRDRRGRHLAKYKSNCGCAICGFDNHKALDFHHVDPSTKVNVVSHMLNQKLSILMDEVRKCEVLCANCHRIYHND